MLYKLLPYYPIIALHNRYLDLNTQENAPKTLENSIYCPVDVTSKGTWIGLNKHGLLLAITNQETQKDKKPRRSRGKLALDVLKECKSSTKAKEYLMDSSIRELYRPGNFIVADDNTAYHIIWDQITTARRIKPGPYAMGVITLNPGFILDKRAEKIWIDSEKRRKRALKLLNDYHPESINEAIMKMKMVSSDHECGKTTASICWHSPDFKQTSSTIIATASNPAESIVSYCRGNACESKFNEYAVSFN